MPQTVQSSANMLVILVVVVVLFVVFNLLDKAKMKKLKEASAVSVKEVARPIAAPPVATPAPKTQVMTQASESTTLTDEVNAVIAAAVAFMLGTEASDSQIVAPIDVNMNTRKRPLRYGVNASNWNKTGREEAIYSRL